MLLWTYNLCMIGVVKKMDGRIRERKNVVKIRGANCSREVNQSLLGVPTASVSDSDRILKRIESEAGNDLKG